MVVLVACTPFWEDPVLPVDRGEWRGTMRLHTSTGHGGKFSCHGGEHKRFRVVAQGTPKE